MCRAEEHGACQTKLKHSTETRKIEALNLKLDAPKTLNHSAKNLDAGPLLYNFYEARRSRLAPESALIDARHFSNLQNAVEPSDAF